MQKSYKHNKAMWLSYDEFPQQSRKCTARKWHKALTDTKTERFNPMS